MKKLMLIALSMVASTMVFAHGAHYQQRYGGDFRQEMNVTHDIMHNASIQETEIDKGLAFDITADAEAVRTSIKKRFMDEQTRLKAYFEGVDVDTESLENGVRVTFMSENESTRNRLKESGRNLIFAYVHSGFTGNRGAQGYHCRGDGYGPGSRDGYHRGPGMMDGYHRGPGMMDGYGYHHQW